MKINVEEFVADLIVYDYILFTSVFVLFILFVILGIVLRRKPLIAVLCILLAFTIFVTGPTYGYIKMHEILFKNTTKVTSQKRLSFTDAIVLKGTLSNDSQRNFQSCKITASTYKVGRNALKNYLYKLKPFKNMSIVEEDIAISQTIAFKIIIEPFTYEKDYNISLGADCK